MKILDMSDEKVKAWWKEKTGVSKHNIWFGKRLESENGKLSRRLFEQVCLFNLRGWTRRRDQSQHSFSRKHLNEWLWNYQSTWFISYFFRKIAFFNFPSILLQTMLLLPIHSTINLKLIWRFTNRKKMTFKSLWQSFNIRKIHKNSHNVRLYFLLALSQYLLARDAWQANILFYYCNAFCLCSLVTYENRAIYCMWKSGNFKCAYLLIFNSHACYLLWLSQHLLVSVSLYDKTCVIEWILILLHICYVTFLFIILSV